MATSLQDVPSSMLEDARKYQALARRANVTLSGKPDGGPSPGPVAGALGEIERLGRSQAREAERLLARRSAG